MGHALPRAPGLPIVGSSIGVVRNPLRFLRDAHARCGPIFEVRAARRRFVVLAGREANRFVGREGRDALESRSFWGKLTERRGCPHAILAVDGEPHTIQRRHYGDVLSRRLVDAHRRGCDHLVRDTFGAGVDQGESFEVRDQTRLLVARMVHHCLTRGAPAVPESTARALIEVFRWETNTLLLGKWPTLALRAPSHRRNHAVAERFIDELVRSEAADDGEGLGGWFQRIREGRRSHPELFTDGDVRFAMLMPFVAGVDTVGATLGFVLHELCCGDPSLRARVHAEVEDAWAEAGGELPPIASLAARPALHGLVLECLRLYPAAFAMYRGVARPFSFADHRIEPGTEVAVFTSATHFDPRYFPEPERLDVNRHAPPRAESRQKQVFMPYGAGPHVCLGAGMGEAMLLACTAAILHHHALESATPGRRYGPSFDPSLALDPRFRLRRT